MDLVAACSGFVYGLETARAMVRGGGLDHVLVIGAEVYSRIVNWKDRASCVLFGDGAGAALVSRTESTEGPRIVDSFLRSRGSGARTLYRPAGGSRTPYVEGETPPEERFLFMDGRQVYNFAVGAVAEAIEAILAKTGFTFDQIDHVVPHQANARIIRAAAKRAGLDFEKFYTNIDRYANTSAASIPIALTEMQSGGMINPGDRIITVGFGSGLAYGANLIIW
jgi:3-oxoacyl-[acyl-carrier-protein] synthase-3